MKPKNRIWFYPFLVMGLILMLTSSCEPDDNKSDYAKAGKLNEAYLKLALGTFNLAQQTSDKSEQKKLYSKTDSLFRIVNFTEFMLDVFKYPSGNLHFDSDNKLSEFIERSFTTSRYLYGRSETLYYDFILSDEGVNKYIFYKIILASNGVTRCTISIDLIRNGEVVSTIDGDEFSVNSEYYGSHMGFILNENINSLPNDIIRFKITASGSDFGTSCGNFESFIKVGQPKNTLNTTVLAERKKAISWCVSNSKWSYPSGAVLDFIAQLDYCVLNGKNGKWHFGWANQKNNQVYQVTWKNNTLSIQKLSKVKADLAGIEASTMNFSIE